MKRGLKFVFVFSFLIVLVSAGFVSAGWFSDFFSSGKISGGVVSENWTPWLNRDNPSGNGEYETLNDFLKEGKACENPLGIECRRISDKINFSETGEVVSCSPSEGLTCVNSNQDDGYCYDYEVRFNCGMFAEGPVCGNGILEEGEECDDGSGALGDGCDANCDIDFGWNCSGSPSVCVENECTTTCLDLDYECGFQNVCGEFVNCGNCSSGYVCQEGVCEKETSDRKCVDPDGGKNYSVASKVVVFEGGRAISERPDYCVDMAFYLREAYCQEGEINFIDHRCENGCLSGACVSLKEDVNWTSWLNRDNPSGNGEYETLNDFLKEGKACENPLGIECRRISDKINFSETGDVVSCSPSKGLTCVNSNQDDGYCDDYEVRFNCGMFAEERCEGECGENVSEISNEKDLTRYSDKKVFLVSDSDWKDVLPLVSLATWTIKEGSGFDCLRGYGTPEDVCTYPLLIYHEEENSFDADSIIWFLQQYGADEIDVFEDVPSDLRNLLILQQDLGAGISSSEIDLFTFEEYFSYWGSFNTVVYVEDDYGTSLLASVYASLINSPLIIEGSSLDKEDNLKNKEVICIGKIDRDCSKYYSIEDVRKEYFEETGTDKIVLVNSNDWGIFVEEDFIPERSVKTFYELYSKGSLTAPVLASAKHQLLLDSNSFDYEEVDFFLKEEIEKIYGSKNLPKYLTLFATPDAIQMSRESDGDYASRKWMEEVDNHVYGNLDDDFFQELAVGRIFSLSSSDVSSYVARDLFYSGVETSGDFSVIWPGLEDNFWFSKPSALAIEDLLESFSFNSVSFITDEFLSPMASDYSDKFALFYLGHAWLGGGSYNFDSTTLKHRDVWLDSSMVFTDGCSTCAYDLAVPKGLSELVFCANLLRRGAIFHYGAAIDDTASNWDTVKAATEELLEGKSIGEATRDSRNKNGVFVNFSSIYSFYSDYDPWTILIGDPTFSPMLEERSLNSFEASFDERGFIEIVLPEVEKGIFIEEETNRIVCYDPNRDCIEKVVHEIKSFNYPFGSEVVYFSVYSFILSAGTPDETQYDYDDQRFVFYIDFPDDFLFGGVESVEWVNSSGTFEISSMPLLGSNGDSSDCKKDSSFINYVRDEGYDNRYYFFMDISYCGNPQITKVNSIIDSSTIKIYLKEN